MIADIIRKVLSAPALLWGIIMILIIRRYKMAKDSASGNRLIANNGKRHIMIIL